MNNRSFGWPSSSPFADFNHRLFDGGKQPPSSEADGEGQLSEDGDMMTLEEFFDEYVPRAFSEPTLPVDELESVVGTIPTITLEDFFEPLMRGKSPTQNGLESRESILESLPEKEDLHAKIAPMLADACGIKRIDGDLYITKGAVLYKITERNLPDLYHDALGPEIANRLKKRAASEIFHHIFILPSVRIKAEDLHQNPNLIYGRDAVFDAATRRIYEVDQVPPSLVGLNIEVRKIGKGRGDAYEAFLSSTFNDDAALIQRFEQSQAAILSMYPIKKIFLYLGNHSCGKSMISRFDMKVLENTSGFGKEDQYIMPLNDINVLGNELGIADATSKHLIVCGDNSNVSIRENTLAALKQLSGSDYIRGRMRHKDYTGGTFKGRILVLSNHPLRGAIDEALINRMVMAPFPRTIPGNEQIVNLDCRLFEEYGYMLGRIFGQIPDLAACNFEHFAEIENDEAWISPSNMPPEDSVTQFCAQCTFQDDSAYTTTEELYEAYKSFCKTTHHEAIPSKIEFGRVFRASCPWVETGRNSKSRGFRGIRLVQKTIG